MRSNSRMKNAGGSDAAPESYADDIEKEANSYFHQMFSSHLSIDAMIQMLTRFKESSDKRYFPPSNYKFIPLLCCLKRFTQHWTVDSKLWICFMNMLMPLYQAFTLRIMLVSLELLL